MRKLFDRFGRADWIDGRVKNVKGFLCPVLMTEAWITLLPCGGG